MKTAIAILLPCLSLGIVSPVKAMTETQQKYAPCLSYYTVGDSAECQPQEEKKKKKKIAAAPSPTIPDEETPQEEVAQPKKRTLQERIKEYMDDHGKPPKEYVQFYLEPTIENAIKWVHTYNEILRRNEQITYAWGQAEKIYENALSEGADMSQFDNPEDPPVQDFGVEVEGYSRPESLAYPAGDPRNNVVRNASTPKVERLGGLAQMPEDIKENITMGGITVPQPPNMTPALPTNLAPNVPLPDQGVLPPPSQAFAALNPSAQALSQNNTNRSIGGLAPVEITYYFSADCPYCKKFEPGFSKLVSELGDKVDVTCVDMTPSGARQTNINGKVDCSWRPAKMGELTKLGITKTPSVTIKKPNSNRLERVVGYVDPDRLRNYLITGEVAE